MRAALAVAAACLAGCYGIEYSHDYDRQEDFGALKTWAWAPALESDERLDRRLSRLDRDRIRKAVENELAAKGYRQVDATSADVRVRYDAAVRSRAQWDTVPRDSWYLGDVYVYDEGVLVIEILRGEGERLIWRGAARMEVEFDMTPEERDARVAEAVHGILEQYPPGAK